MIMARGTRKTVWSLEFILPLEMSGRAYVLHHASYNL